jgi:hypothetical protein
MLMGHDVSVTDHGVVIDHLSDGNLYRVLVATVTRERAEHLYAEAERMAEDFR